MTSDHTPKDYLDNLEEEDGFVPLICSKCSEVFRGWKLKKVCRLCAVPDFPKGVRHITHVAVQYNGLTYSLPAPDRHHHMLRLIYKVSGPLTLVNGNTSVQGFLDNDGNFLDRKEALILATSAKQIKCESSIRSNQLFSEDLW